MRRTGSGHAARDADFIAFCRAESDRLQRFATFVCGDADLAADLAQEALTRAYARWHRLDARDPSAYVRRIVVNAVRDRSRKERVRRGRREGVLPSEVASHDLTTTERMSIVPVLASLSPIRRAVVVLRFYEDMTEQQIADVLDRPASTVRSDLHRALKALRPLLEEDELIGGSRER